MDDLDGLTIPARFETVLARARERGFLRSCYPRLGALLRTLAASKPGGRMLELGTGMGGGAAWLLDGMDAASRLVTVELEAAVQDVARIALGDDPRITFVRASADAFLEGQPAASVDLVFADTGPGKFSHLDHAVRVLRPGGLYVADNLLIPHPAPGRGSERTEQVLGYLAALSGRDDLVTLRLAWSSGVVVCARR